MTGRALVTGIRGFTGRYVAAELSSAGFEVFGSGTTPSDGDKHYQQVDLGDLAGLKRVVAAVQPQVVVHLAAKAFVAHDDVNSFYRVNLIGTRNLLESLAGQDSPPECVLLASSANVYGNISGGMLSEATSPNPANDYAVSKLAMEYMARLWLPSLPLVITRPFNYTGIGQSTDFVVAKIADHFRRRADTIELGNLDVRRDFSDVRAVAKAYRRLVEVKPTGETVNVCSGVTHSLQGVINLAQEITGHRMQVRVNPAFVRASEVHSLCGDPSLLRRLIGEWQTPPLEDTLRWMLGESC